MTKELNITYDNILVRLSDEEMDGIVQSMAHILAPFVAREAGVDERTAFESSYADIFDGLDAARMGAYDRLAASYLARSHPPDAN